MATSTHHPAELVVGSRAGIESTLLADVYTGALRSYGFPARTEQAPDPLSKLDSGAFVVVPSLTGRVLQVFQPGAGARSDAQVYKAMIGALPEGIAAGDYTTAAEDKPALAVAGSTSKDWGGSDLGVLARHCDGLTVGSVAGAVTPSAVGQCRLPASHEFPDDAALFAAVNSGEVTAAWTTTADPNVPADLGGAHRRQVGAGAGRERGAALPPQRTDRSSSCWRSTRWPACWTPPRWSTCAAR